jgi:16S rRNA (adenine1518-N6/adenine1519-N6)-dimethyltransferase
MSTQIALLKKYGLPIRGYSGQHILIDPNVQRKIVNSLDPKPRDKVLEIGPGLGALTEEILKRGSRVLAVEKDKRFAEILEGELSRDYGKKLEIIHGDILKLKLDRLKPSKDKTLWKVMSNLPYYITAPILFHLIGYRRLVSKAVLTMQKEVANRLLAPPGSKDYGRLTLAVRYAADIRYLFDISSTCFTPRPEVDSSVVELTFHSDSQMPQHMDEPLLFHLIQAAFSQRRKTLLHIFSRDPKIKKNRDALLLIFKAAQIDPSARGENLLLKDFFTLTEKLAGSSKSSP